MNLSDIMNVIPHRHPFLFVDKVIAKSDGDNPGNRNGSKVTAIKNVTCTEPHFEGHFPGLAIMPGVLQIEAMAQAACLALYKKGDPKRSFFIGSIQDAKFRRPVVPGDTLVLHAEVINDRGTVIVVKTYAEVEGHVVAEARMVAKIIGPV